MVKTIGKNSHKNYTLIIIPTKRFLEPQNNVDNIGIVT